MQMDLLEWRGIVDARILRQKVMTQILKATCVNGGLLLEQPLNPRLEGKTVELVVIESNHATVTELDEMAQWKERALQFLEKAKAYSGKLPPDYKFDRNEIYDR
jgi:hypothetical protein